MVTKKNIKCHEVFAFEPGAAPRISPEIDYKTDRFSLNTW